jgi:hypothetical protein
MKSSKIEGHFRIYIVFFGAKKKVIEFSILGSGKDVMSSDGSEKHCIFNKLESKTIIFGYRSFPSMFSPLDSFNSERRMFCIV